MLGLQAGILIGNLTTFISIEVVTAITFTAAIESDNRDDTSRNLSDASTLFLYCDTIRIELGI